MSGFGREALERWGGLLAGEGFPWRLVRAGEEGTPHDTLLVGVGGEGAAHTHQLELSFVPGMEAQLQGAALLQCFAAVPAEVRDAAVPELLRTIALVNGRLPLVGFGYLEAERMPCFRHVLMLPAAPGAADPLVVQTTWVASYLLTVFGEAVAAAASGRLGADAALAGTPFAGLFRG